ncbi:hypothetical protein AB0H58_32360 [Nocardia neocaledoniensis]|uniref:hypothetical protein n=1 Tax=Nocardia neocaledoniensis TaxID=236511 RepID=UPI003410CEB6
MTDATLAPEIADRVERARAQIAWQYDPALTEALSEDELRAERELAEELRSDRRETRRRIERAQLQAEEDETRAELSAAEKARTTEASIQKADTDDYLAARKVLAKQRRAASPHSKIAVLATEARWVSWLMIGVVSGAMLFSAVNVQHNLAPDGMGEPLYWVAYGVEALISLCLVALMLTTKRAAEWMPEASRNKAVAAEVALLVLSIALNAYPYHDDLKKAAAHSLGPVMVGIAMLIHSYSSTVYGRSLAEASKGVPADDPLLLPVAHRAPQTAHQPEPRTATEPRTAQAQAEPHTQTAHDEPHTANRTPAHAQTDEAPRIDIAPSAVVDADNALDLAPAEIGARAADADRTATNAAAAADVDGSEELTSPDSPSEWTAHTAHTAAEAVSTAIETKADDELAQISQQEPRVAPQPAMATAHATATSVGAHALDTAHQVDETRTDNEELAGHRSRHHAMADEILRRKPTLRTPHPKIVEILQAGETDAGYSVERYSSIAREVDCWHGAVKRLLEMAVAIEGEALTGATVLTLRPASDRA